MAVAAKRSLVSQRFNERFFSSHEADMKYAWASVRSLLQLCKVGGGSTRPSPPSPARWRRNVWQTHIHKDTAVVLKVPFFPWGPNLDQHLAGSRANLLFHSCCSLTQEPRRGSRNYTLWDGWIGVLFKINLHSSQKLLSVRLCDTLRVNWHISSLSLARLQSVWVCGAHATHFMHHAMLITIKHVLVRILNCPLVLPGAAAKRSANECHTLKTCWCIKLF